MARNLERHRRIKAVERFSVIESLTYHPAPSVQQFFHGAKVFAALVWVRALIVAGVDAAMDDRFREDFDFQAGQRRAAVPIEEIAGAALFGKQPDQIERPAPSQHRALQ